MDVAHFELDLRTIETIGFGPFAGAVLRGGFGVAFKRVSCPLRHQPCETCLLAPSCVYQRVFETPVPSGVPLLPPDGKAPHPFVIDAPEDAGEVVAAGETTTFGLVLIGDAIPLLPYFLYAFRRLGELGLGRGRGRFVLAEVRLRTTRPPGEMIYRDGDETLTPGPYGMSLPSLPEHPPEKEAEGGMVSLDLRSPLRLKEGGRYGQRLTFPTLIKHLLRRITLLHACHGGGTPAWDPHAWIAAAEAVTVVDDTTTWRDCERYSTRQRTRMSLGGWQGSVSFTGPWQPFLPLLRAGELVHVGQGTAFGLGQIRVGFDE